MDALALTDAGNLYGAIEFYKECKKENIKPIIGIDGYMAVRTRFDMQSGVDNKRRRIVLLAKNIIGYRNLLKLVTSAHLEGFYYKPRFDWDLLNRHSGGLIAIIPATTSDVSAHLRNGDTERSTATAKKYLDIFGNDNVYFEISHHPEIEGHSALVEKIRLIAKQTGSSTVAAQEIYYISEGDRRARETLMSVQQNADFAERSFDGGEPDFSFRSEKDMLNFFRNDPQSLQNTEKIRDACDVELELGKWVFPNFIVESGRTYNDELRHIVYQGIAKRGLSQNDEITTRIEYELNIIFAKGYSPYFLVVGDLLRFAHENNILTTIRGSVAGSMVTYLAGITNVNPLEYKLPFERFLNPERPSAPDIDMDYADNRRDEVIEYAKRKYGHDKVAQIGTFGTMMARGAVRDVARALGYPYATGDRIAKLIPMGSQGFPMTLERAFEIVPELKEMYKKEEEAKDVIDMAKKIEGCARHISVHAAGVVISPTPLTDFVPLQHDTKGEAKIITQYDMHAIEDAGLLKFDFLGIKNLSILADAVATVKSVYGITVDIENINVDDKKTFDLLARGETGGLFQLNGSGMTNYLKQLKPTSIFDINAMVALYRPGPMESIPSYIERKHNPRLVTFLDPRMKEILFASYGVITYQDDVLMISIKLGGFSWLEADKLRKAMGKKIPAEMEAQKEKLLTGLQKNGMPGEKAKTLWKLIEPFAAYGFGKAHAASYGRVAYQTAYMKANFPAVYMASVLTADAGDVEKVGEIIAECKRMGIPVLPPDINESYSGFTAIVDQKSADGTGVGDTIRFGLTSIKNFGEGIANSIIAERQKRGKFTSISNFLERIDDKNLNKKSLESLIKCGALDSLGTRGTLLHNLDSLLGYNKESRQTNGNQNSLFGLMVDSSSVPTLRLESVPEASIENRLSWEKELLGLYVSGHPLDRIRDQIEKNGMSIAKARAELKEGAAVVLPGIIEEVRELLTKKGERMMFVKLADYTGNIEAVIFPRVFEESKSLLRADNCVAIKGRMSNRNGTQSIIVDKMKQL